MKLESCQPFLLNEMFQVYVQQKYNSTVEISFGKNYFISCAESKRLVISYFEELFEDVHLTEQEDGTIGLELFDLKKEIVQEFDYLCQNQLLTKTYLKIISYLEKQDVLRRNVFGTLAKKFVIPPKKGNARQDIFINQLVRKYSIISNSDYPLIVVQTPLLRLTEELKEKISSYFGSFFCKIFLHVLDIDDKQFIKAIFLSDLMPELLDNTIGVDLITLLQGS